LKTFQTIFFASLIVTREDLPAPDTGKAGIGGSNNNNNNNNNNIIIPTVSRRNIMIYSINVGIELPLLTDDGDVYRLTVR